MNLLQAALPLQLKALELRAGGKREGRRLCQDLTIQLHAGERWILLGPNGAGKSTLLIAIAGLLRLAAGDILLDARSITAWDAESLARQRAWCPQFWLDPFPVSAWETVACARLATHPELDAQTVREEAFTWLARLDAASLAHTDVRTLSGGERQRVALATACAQQAPLLLLDEPTSHLDWSHQALLQDLLKSWSAHQGTVIAAVHDLNLAWSLGTHVLLLDGQGGSIWGSREDVMQEHLLSKAFGIEICVQEEYPTRWFRVNLEKHQ